MTTSAHDAYVWTAQVLRALRGSLEDHGFSEILPAILSERYEPGARHSVAVLGDRQLPDVTMGADPGGSPQVRVLGREYYYLPVSHCVEKQLAVEHVDRVYCVAPCVRLLMEGETRSDRHLYTFFQVEIEWKTADLEDVYHTVEAILSRFAHALLDRGTHGRRHLIEALTAVPFRRLPFLQARQELAGVGGATNPHAADDLTREEEEALSAKANAPFWLIDYPLGARDSLFRSKSPGIFATYDLILPHGYGEVATGGLRPESGDDIVRQAQRLTQRPHRYYADWKSRTGIQTGGIGIGLERLIRYCAGMESVLELRFPHDQGPNSKI